MESNNHTISFYKLESKKLKRELGIRHTEALDITAKKYGFSNWKHCLRSCDAKPEPSDNIIAHVTFTDWLSKQVNRDSPLGDLARDVKTDSTWPSFDSFEQYESYLRSKGAARDAMYALKNAWKSYNANLKRSLLPNKDKIVAKIPTPKNDIRKIVFVKNVIPLHYSKRIPEKFNVGDEAWISNDGRKAIPVVITEVDERHYSFRVERPLKNAGDEYYYRLDEVRSTPELACLNRLTS